MQYESNDRIDRVKKLKQKRKAQKKQRRKRAAASNKQVDDQDQSHHEEHNVVEDNVTDEQASLDDAMAKEYFQHVFDRFSVESHQKPKGEEKEAQSTTTSVEKQEKETSNERLEPVSRKILRKMMRFTLEELKQLAKSPEVVEAWDTSASDPSLLLALKSYRNTVPVPVHWRQRDPYLRRKRVPEKPEYQLPDFIKQTGISEMRDALKEKEAAAARGRAKRRARLNPKLGKMDLDYQILYEAFFVHQTPPKLTIHGDLYYEGKEHLDALRNRKPGVLSDALKTALGITADMPPPWLYAMQRYGPPPSYPSLKIPGVNAPIPSGAEWGYHPGGWGYPPVDDFNRPLYGDVFGVLQQEEKSQEATTDIDRTLWGELEFDNVHSVAEDIEGQSDNEKDMDVDANEESDTEDNEHGKEEEEEEITEIEIPDDIELRKETREIDDEDGAVNAPSSPRALYKVLEPKPATVRGFMGSQHTYTGI